MTPPQNRLTSLDDFKRAAECLKVVAHPLRLRMTQMLMRGRFNVGQLAKSCDLSVSMTSEHLRLMQRSALITSEKEGKFVYYLLEDEFMSMLIRCLETHHGCGDTLTLEVE